MKSFTFWSTAWPFSVCRNNSPVLQGWMAGVKEVLEGNHSEIIRFSRHFCSHKENETFPAPKALLPPHVATHRRISIALEWHLENLLENKTTGLLFCKLQSCFCQGLYYIGKLIAVFCSSISKEISGIYTLKEQLHYLCDGRGGWNSTQQMDLILLLIQSKFKIRQWAGDDKQFSFLLPSKLKTSGQFDLSKLFSWHHHI